MMSTETLALIFDASATVVNAACVVTVWGARRSFARHTELGELEKRISFLERGPDWDVLNELKNTLSDVRMAIAKVETALEIRSNAIERIEQFLRERSRD